MRFFPPENEKHCERSTCSFDVSRTRGKKKSKNGASDYWDQI